MSIIKPGVTGLRHFFRSGPMPCPYLPGRIERKLSSRLTGRIPRRLTRPVPGWVLGRRPHDGCQIA